jgi:hypothetical protein
VLTPDFDPNFYARIIVDRIPPTPDGTDPNFHQRIVLGALETAYRLMFNQQFRWTSKALRETLKKNRTFSYSTEDFRVVITDGTRKMYLRLSPVFES